MSLQKINELYGLSLDEIKKKIKQQEKEIFETKFHTKLKHTTKTHILKNQKHYLSQLLTLAKQKSN